MLYFESKTYSSLFMEINKYFNEWSGTVLNKERRKSQLSMKLSSLWIWFILVPFEGKLFRGVPVTSSASNVWQDWLYHMVYFESKTYSWVFHEYQQGTIHYSSTKRTGLVEVPFEHTLVFSGATMWLNAVTMWWTSFSGQARQYFSPQHSLFTLCHWICDRW